MTDLEKMLEQVTPGEWEVVTPPDGIWPPRVFSGSFIVCMVDNSDALQIEREANARLIAMATALARKVIALRAENDSCIGVLRQLYIIQRSGYHSVSGDWFVPRGVVREAARLYEEFTRQTAEADEALASWESAQ